MLDVPLGSGVSLSTILVSSYLVDNLSDEAKILVKCWLSRVMQRVTVWVDFAHGDIGEFRILVLLVNNDSGLVIDILPYHGSELV